MGMFDSFHVNSIELQLKNGECALNEFQIGDFVKEMGYEDGIYVDATGPGFVVIFNGIYVAGFDKNSIIDKWGNKLDFDRIKECHS